MRILRLLVQNWRGIESREIEFGPGVTIVEGPNEAGKSTMIEALDRLLHELDSTNKQQVRSAQPLGQDVGSTVEVELKTGEYHFVYRKTFNKNRRTTLTIEAPAREQLTGRDAHQRATEILEQTVDMGLWRALLVEQGAAVAPAQIKDSTGLARALDAAAGSTQPDADDASLLARVEVEYERYFTPKAGKPRYAEQENAVVELRARLAAAQAAVDEVASDLDEYEKLRQTQRRIAEELPGHGQRLEAAEKKWAAVAELNAGIVRLEEAEKLQAERQELVARALDRRESDIAQREKAAMHIDNLQEKLRILVAAHAEAAARADEARERLSAARTGREAAEQLVVGARRDERQFRAAQDLHRLRGDLDKLDALRTARGEARAVLAANRVDDQTLAAISAAERALESARIRLDAVATRVSLTAEKALELSVDGDPVPLAAGGRTERDVATRLELSMPGVFELTVEPAQSADELHGKLREEERRLAALLGEAGVDSMADAARSQQRRNDAEKRLTGLQARAADLLRGRDPEELAAEVDALAGELGGAGTAGADLLPSPERAATLARALAEAESGLREADERIRTAQERHEIAQKSLAEASGAKTETEQGLQIAESAQRERDLRLAEERARKNDEALRAALNDCERTLENIQTKLAGQRTALAGFSPDSLEESLENARAVLARAQGERDEAAGRAALLEDRLKRAQADGCYETLEREQANLEHAQETLMLTQRRAAAARRLHETLHRHRDAARRNYIAPLRERIDRLGRIVYGAGFAIELDDEWTLISRTLDGVSVPFGDLSIGAREQIGILARLAVAQLVAADGGVPLIVDDALGFSDPERLRDMGTAIAAAGKACQVIVLTCFPGRYAHVGNARVVRFQ